MRERRKKDRGNLTEGEGTLGRGEGNSAGTRSRQKLVQLVDILLIVCDTINSVRGGREEGEHLGRPILVSLLDGGDEVLLRHLQQHSRLKPTQADTFFVFFFFVGIFSFDFLGGRFLLSSEGGEDKAAERAALHSLSSLRCASKPIGCSSASALKPL